MVDVRSLFQHLPSADRAIVQAVLEPMTFPAGTLLFDVGAPGDAAFLVEEGTIRVEVDVPNVDTEGIVAYLGPGEVLGEVALLDGAPRSARAVADTEVRARRVRIEALTALGAEHPGAVLAIYRALARDAATKLRTTTARLTDVLFDEVHDPEVDAMVARAEAAQSTFARWSEARVDRLLTAVADAVAHQAESLAEQTVVETGLGHAPDKAVKIQVASQAVRTSLRAEPGAGELRTHDGVTEIAAPVGVVFGLIPLTNPVPTAVFKILIALKNRNAIVMSFHHGALDTANRFGGLIERVLADEGAPVGLVQWVRERSSRQRTQAFMRHPGIAMVLATGGAGIVRAAYRSGTPALGVGPGNAPVLVTADADLEHAARSIVESKAFDHGLVCGAEHNLVVEAEVADAFRAALERHGAAVLAPTEVARFEALALDPDHDRFRPRIAGRSARALAEAAAIRRDHEVRVLVAPCVFDGTSTPWTREKSAPVLSLFVVPDADGGIALSKALLGFDGQGHTAIVHTADDDLARRFAEAVPAGRILVNAPGATGVFGVCTGLTPSFTLGCGTYGGTSTTDNVSFTHLRNVKRMARYRAPAA